MQDKLRILHVDDDADTRDIVALSLQMAGEVELLQFHSGREAVDQAERFAPDVVLLDYMMPEMSGPEILEELKATASLSEVPVIFMTGRLDDKDVAEMLASGASSVIAKPFDPTELLALIEDGAAGSPQAANRATAAR